MSLTPLVMYFIGFLIDAGSLEQLNGNIRSITEITTDLHYNNIRQTKTIYLYDRDGHITHKEDSTPFVRHYDYTYTNGLITKYKQTSFIDHEDDDIQFTEFEYDNKKRLVYQKHYTTDTSDVNGFVDHHLINYDDNKQVSHCTNIRRFLYNEKETFPSMAYYKDGKIYKEWTIARNDTLYRYYTYNNQGNLVSIKSTHPSGNSIIILDDHGRIIERSFYKGKEKELIKYTYTDLDKMGNYQRMESSDSTIITRKIEYY